MKVDANSMLNTAFEFLNCGHYGRRGVLFDPMLLWQLVVGPFVGPLVLVVWRRVVVGTRDLQLGRHTCRRH